MSKRWEPKRRLRNEKETCDETTRRKSSSSNGRQQWYRSGHGTEIPGRRREGGDFRAKPEDAGSSGEIAGRWRAGVAGRHGQPEGNGEVSGGGGKEVWQDRCAVRERRSRKIRAAHGNQRRAI